MEIVEKIMQKKWLFSIVMSIVMLCACTVALNYEAETNVVEQGIVGLVVGALIGVVVAVALLPTIANQSETLSGNADLDTASQTLVGLWPLLVIVGVMIAIIGFAL